LVTRFQSEGKIARDALRDIYEHFDHYDMAILPMQHGTNSSETPHIDIVRISPTDAKNLCDVPAAVAQQLAGRMYFSGAFFAKSGGERYALGPVRRRRDSVRDLLRNTPVAKLRRSVIRHQKKRRLQPNDSGPRRCLYR
jgi:hypothetical protein